MDLDKALSNVRELAPETKLVFNAELSEIYWVDIYLKYENEAPIWSYKWRGAGNAIANLLDHEKKKGVLCASAWHHAQWVALASKKFRIPSTIVMPQTAPRTKVDKTKSIGWEYTEVILHGDSFDEAFIYAQQLLEEQWKAFIHPFDDANVVAGQATVTMEILNQMQECERNTSMILTGVGGWGILAGSQAAINHYWANTQLIWVEPENAPSMKRALENGRPTLVGVKNTIADGAKVAKVGERWYQAARDHKIQIVQSPEWRLCTTLLDMYGQRVILEWAWALWVDGLKSIAPEVFQEISKKSWSVVVILTWGNMDPAIYDVVIEKSERYTWYKKDIVVTFPQREHALAEFTWLLPNWVNIVHMNYDEKSNASAAPWRFTLTFNTQEIFQEFMRITKEKDFKVKVLRNKF
jgi:threonine dehydratase